MLIESNLKQNSIPSEEDLPLIQNKIVSHLPYCLLTISQLCSEVFDLHSTQRLLMYIHRRCQPTLSYTQSMYDHGCCQSYPGTLFIEVWMLHGPIYELLVTFLQMLFSNSTILALRLPTKWRVSLKLKS